VRDEYFSECRNGEWEGIGFGHLSGAPAELIVEAVREIKVVPLIPRTKSAEVKCRPPDFDEKCRTLTTLIEAADAGCVDKVRQILAVFGIDAQAGKRSEALDFAIRSDHVEVVKMLLEHKAPVNPTVGDEDPPLHSAAWFHHLEILRLLIKAGAKVDAENDHGETFLASFGYFDTDVARELLEAGANPNARDRNNATPLMRAASYGFEGMVRLLLDHGANVDLTDKDGRTALMYAAKGNDIERQYYIDAIPLLLAKKADYRKRDKSGQTAFDIAVKSKHSYAVDLLNDAGLKRAPR
jgi:ankyrin repeat protein